MGIELSRLIRVVCDDCRKGSTRMGERKIVALFSSGVYHLIGRRVLCNSCLQEHCQHGTMPVTHVVNHIAYLTLARSAEAYQALVQQQEPLPAPVEPNQRRVVIG